MRTLLVITKQASLANAIQTVLDPIKFQLITKEAVNEAEFLLSRGARLDLRDREYRGTPVGWAEYHKHEKAAAWLRARVAG